MNLQYKDFKSICRLCLEKHQSLVSIYNEEVSGSSKDDTIIEMIENCMGVQLLPNDKLPKCICTNCLNELKSFNRFRRKCLYSVEVLQDIIDQCEIELNDDYDEEHVIDVFGIENDYEEVIRDDREDQIIENYETEIYKLENESIGEETDDIQDENSVLFLSTMKLLEPNEESAENDYSGIENILTNDENSQTINADEPNEENAKGDHPEKENVSTNDESLQTINPDELNNSSKLKKISKKNRKRTRQSLCEICGKIYSCCRSYHFASHAEFNKHKCTICGKEFRLKISLKDHLVAHINTRPHKCDVCGKGFNSKATLNSHKVQHTTEKKYECEICGEKFKYGPRYRYHKKRLHKKFRDYVCDMCGKEFIEKYRLNEHYRIHTGEKPYECKECGKKCIRSSGLREHMKVHTKKISHFCNVCGDGFIYRATLKTHMNKRHAISYSDDINQNNESISDLIEEDIVEYYE